MNPPTFRKQLISAINSVLVNVDAVSNNKLIFFTPSGVIRGTPATEPVDSEDVTVDNVADEIQHNFLNRMATHAAEAYKKKLDIDNFSGDDGCLVLNDVTISVSADFEYRCNQFVVFYNQITGFTIGSD